MIQKKTMTGDKKVVKSADEDFLSLKDRWQQSIDLIEFSFPTESKKKPKAPTSAK